MWTEISSNLTQTYLHIFIKVWARGFHSTMDFISFFFFLLIGNGNSPMRIRLQCTLFLNASWELKCKPSIFKWSLPKNMDLFFVRNVAYASGSILPFCLGSSASMTKQSKKLTWEVELFKHTLALCPISVLSGHFPRAPWSLLNRGSQNLCQGKAVFPSSAFLKAYAPPAHFSQMVCV